MESAADWANHSLGPASRLSCGFGIALIVLSTVGMFADGAHLYGLLNQDPVSNVMHLLLGVVLLIVACCRVSTRTQIRVAAGGATVLLVAALISAADEHGYGLAPSGFTIGDSLFDLTVGLVLLVSILRRENRITSR